MSTKASEIIKKSIRESSEAISKLDEKSIEEIAQKIIGCYKAGGKVMFCGNGGSASQAQHLAAELVCKFRLKRNAYDAMSLTTDTSILTAQSNDYGFDSIFERQVEAHGKKGDILVGLSTSGNSPNVVKAMELAKKLGVYTIGIIGNNRECNIAKIADKVLFIESSDTPRIQEAHITAGHIICDLVEKGMTHG